MGYSGTAYTDPDSFATAMLSSHVWDFCMHLFTSFIYSHMFGRPGILMYHKGMLIRVIAIAAISVQWIHVGGSTLGNAD